MWPFLINWGPIQVRTILLFFAVAAVMSLFAVWRKAREEHYPEDEVVDGLLVSGMVGVVAGRAAYIGLNFSQFGFNPLNWLNIVELPGTIGIVAVLAAGWYLYRVAEQAKWDAFEVLDFAVLGLSAALFFVSVGQFFDGSAFGTATRLPWGVVFPGVLEKHHPAQLYFAAFYALMWWYLSYAEYRYRTFQWYRGGKNTAQTGFLLSVFLLGLGSFSLIMSFFKPGAFVIQGFAVDWAVYAVMAVAGGWLLGVRSHLLKWGRR